MAAWRYEISLLVQHLKRNFLSPRGHVISSIYVSETTTLHVHHVFLYISYPSLQVCNLKLPNFTSLVYGIGEHSTRIFFFYSQIWSFWIQPQKIISPRFYKLKESE